MWGKSFTVDGLSASTVAATAVAYAKSSALKPTAATYETMSRVDSVIQNNTILSTGRLSLVAITLPSGLLIRNITFVSGTQAAVTPTNQWFALFDSARVKLGVTADDTTTAWSASATKALTLSSPFTTTYAGLHYLGICVVAGTVPSLLGTSTAVTTVANLPPILAGTSTSSLTNPASCPTPAGALTVQASSYAYVS